MCQFVTVYIRMKKSLQQKRHLWEEVSFLTPEGVKAYNRVGVESYKLSKCYYADSVCQKYVSFQKVAYFFLFIDVAFVYVLY